MVHKFHRSLKSDGAKGTGAQFMKYTFIEIYNTYHNWFFFMPKDAEPCF